MRGRERPKYIRTKIANNFSTIRYISMKFAHKTDNNDFYRHVKFHSDISNGRKVIRDFRTNIFWSLSLSNLGD